MKDISGSQGLKVCLGTSERRDLGKNQNMDGFNRMKKDELLEKITYQYLRSREFNGQALSGFESEKEHIIALIREGKIEINFGDRHPNPHIKAFEVDDKDAQIAKIESIGFEYACVYPTKEHLKNVVDVNDFKGVKF